MYMESVEWMGPLNVWRYSRKLRSVVCKLGALRLKACHEIAHHLCVEEIQKIRLLTDEHSRTDGTDALLDMLEQFQPQDSLLELSNQSLFDSSDRIDVLKDYVPSLSIMLISFGGYRSLLGGVLKRQSIKVGKISRLLFAGLAIAGLGLLLFKFVDMRRGIQRKITQKMHNYFLESNFVTNNSNYVSSSTRRVLQTGVSELQRRFQTKVDLQEAKYLSQKVAKNTAELNAVTFRTIQTRTIDLHKRLLAIRLI